MEALGFPFTVRITDIDETPSSSETPARTVLRLSKEKTQAAAAQSTCGEEIIIAADTLVVCDGQIMGKPVGVDEATTMLQTLRGRWHEVMSGLTVLDEAAGRMVKFLSVTEVCMRDYVDAEIRKYVDSGEPYDKAGGYAIQDGAFHPVSEVVGCYAGVVGFPLCHLGQALEDLGVALECEMVPTCADVTGQVCDLASRLVGSPRHPGVPRNC